MLTECFEHFPSNKNSRMFKKGANEIYLGKIAENLNFVEFPKYKPVNQQFWEFCEERQMKLKLLLHEIFKICSVFWKFWKMLIHRHHKFNKTKLEFSVHWRAPSIISMSLLLFSGNTSTL